MTTHQLLFSVERIITWLKALRCVCALSSAPGTSEEIFTRGINNINLLHYLFICLVVEVCLDLKRSDCSDNIISTLRFLVYHDLMWFRCHKFFMLMTFWEKNCPNVCIKTSYCVNNITDIVGIVFQLSPRLNVFDCLRHEIGNYIKLIEFFELQYLCICCFLSVWGFSKELLIGRLEKI